MLTALRTGGILPRMTSRTAAVASLATAFAVAVMSLPAIFPAPPSRPFPLPLDLNSASAAQLDLLPSVGPRTAERIVADREKNGPFRSPADVRRVPGLPRRAAERISRLAVAR